MSYVESFENKIKEVIFKNNLFNKNDKIIVAASGGKDSTSILYILNKLGFNVEAVHVNLLMGEYSRKHVSNLTSFCKEQGIVLHVISIRDALGSTMCFIRSRIQASHKMNNCMICGVIKRSLLNKKVKELNATKIVTGHNLDDLSESVLMNVFNCNPSLSLGLGFNSGIERNNLFIQRVKPFNYTLESDIRKYSELMGFPVLYDICPCSSNASRRFVRNLINDLEKSIPKIKENIGLFNNNLMPLLSKCKKTGELRACVSCGEPSNSEVCQSCNILSLLK